MAVMWEGEPLEQFKCRANADLLKPTDAELEAAAEERLP
jgi:hypothetical protein